MTNKELLLRFRQKRIYFLGDESIPGIDSQGKDFSFSMLALNT